MASTLRDLRRVLDEHPNTVFNAGELQVRIRKLREDRKPHSFFGRIFGFFSPAVKEVETAAERLSRRDQRIIVKPSLVAQHTEISFRP